MSVGQPFRVLNLYDVLTNLIPGVVIIGSPYIYYDLEFSLETVFTILIAGYLAGHAVQFLRTLIQTPSTFQETMEIVKEGTASESPLGKVTTVQKEFVEICWEEFDLDETYNSYGELFKMLLSYLETVPASRALRFQAIYSFNRSMVISLVITAAIAIIAILLDLFGILYTESIFKVFGILIGSLIGCVVFHIRTEEFEKDFVRYVILDFYQDQVTKKQ